MKIQVLGGGCQTCKNLFELTKRAVKELAIDNDVEYITGADGIQAIAQMGVMSSPVLAIDSKPVMIGSTSDIEKVKKLISDAK